MIDITPHIPMVKRMARRYRGTPLGHEDAEGIGYLALVEAARSWGPHVGCPFVAYACRRVKFAMVDAIRFSGGQRRAVRPDWEVVMDHEEMAERFSVENRSSRLLDALSTLRTRVRYVVVLTMCGYASTDIAVHMGVSASRVSQLLSEGRKGLALAGVAP